MNKKKILSCCALVLTLCASHAHGVIPQAEVILRDIIKKNLFNNLSSVNFNLIKAAGPSRDRASLVLNKTGLYDNNNQAINLYILDILIKNPSYEILKNYLDSQHINSTVVSLGIFANEPAYIIGAQPGDTKSPQLWVGKYNNYILKELTGDHEIIFDKYEALKIPHGFFPRVITLDFKKSSTTYFLSEK